MSDSVFNPAPSLNEAVNILKACQALADRLLAKGVIVELSEQEQKDLKSYEKVVLADYNENDWRYLRVASGLKINAVAALDSCLRYRNAGQSYTYGQL
jgi:hypothetical protein